MGVLAISGYFKMGASVSDQQAAGPEDKGEFFAQHYRGVSNPKVEVSENAFRMEVEPSVDETRASDSELDELGKPFELDISQGIGISLESILVEVNNQSYGMISASTGCASNRGGPSC